MIEICKIKKEDSQDFIRMATEFYSGPGVLHAVDPKVIQRTLDEILRDSPFLEGFIFKKEGKAVGFAELSYSFAPEVGGKSIFIEEIFVDAEHRGQGIGHMFLDFCTSLVKGDVRRIRLEATRSNEKAIALYRSYGFKELDYMQMVIDKP